MYTVLDLFCGAGGLSLGFELTQRFQILAGIDHDKWGLKTFYQNHQNLSKVLSEPCDVQQLVSSDIIRALQVAHIDVIVGGPPCQGFSVAGRREADDTRNTLIWDYYRLIADLSPTAFVMENVPGLLLAVDKSGKKLTDVLVQRYQSLGYICSLWILNAVDYGVPQVRKRAFLIGIKSVSPVCCPPPKTGTMSDMFNKCAPVVTAGEALYDLPVPNNSEPQEYTTTPETDYQKYLRLESSFLHNHTPSVHKQEMVERLKLQLPGTRLYPNWNHSWHKIDPQKPSPTVKENHRAPFVHPISPRVTTPRECARLQSFPDRFIFSGTKTAQLVQIGNAVPPLLAKAIAEEVAQALDRIIYSVSTRSRTTALT